MSKKTFCFALCAMLLALSFPAEAQQPRKVPLIGFLTAGSGSTRLPLLRKVLRELGYVDGQNIAIVTRAAYRKRDRLPRLAAELVNLKVDVLFAANINAALVAKKATRTIPIVFLSSLDPVAAGLIDSLARPGGNLTGLTHIAAVLFHKRLELLKEIIPNLSRVAGLWEPGNPGSESMWKESQLAARGLGLQLHSLEVTSADQFERAFQEATKADNDALVVTLSTVIHGNRRRIADLAIKNRLPAIYADSRFVRSGGLMSYAPDRGIKQYRRAATYVDKILKGAKPADLPVERPTKFELIINLKTAKKLGLTIPPEVLYTATKVIK